MTKEKAYAWMDRQIEAYRMTREPASDDVYCIERHLDFEAQIKGVKELARAAQLPVTISPWDGYTQAGDPDAEFALVYRGFRFFELERNVFHEAGICDT